MNRRNFLSVLAGFITAAGTGLIGGLFGMRRKAVVDPADHGSLYLIQPTVPYPFTANHGCIAPGSIVPYSNDGKWQSNDSGWQIVAHDGTLYPSREALFADGKLPFGWGQPFNCVYIRPFDPDDDVTIEAL